MIIEELTDMVLCLAEFRFKNKRLLPFEKSLCDESVENKRQKYKFKVY